MKGEEPPAIAGESVVLSVEQGAGMLAQEGLGLRNDCKNWPAIATNGKTDSGRAMRSAQCEPI